MKLIFFFYCSCRPIYFLRNNLAFFFLFLSSGGWGKLKLKLTTLPRIFIRVVCRFNSVPWFSFTSSQNYVFRPLGDDTEFLSQFPTHQPPNVFLTEA